MFTQDRKRTRAFFRESWRKHLADEPLEPLERQVATLIAEHPEYHALMHRDDDAGVDQSYSAESGQENPFMHLALHLALREQVGTDRPAGIAAITRSLLLRHGDGHEVEHRMMEALGLSLWEAQRQGKALDDVAYLDALRRLL